MPSDGSDLKEAFGRIGNAIKGFWQKLGTAMRVITVVILVGMIAAIAAVLIISSQTKYVSLFSGVSSSEAGEIYQLLQEDGVDAYVESGMVMVPADEADALRVQLNAEGYPQSGLNYDVFLNNATAFGMTESEKRIVYQMQLQDNIRQTLRTMAMIDDATVNVSLAEESRYVLSAQETDEAKASVTVQVKGGAVLSEQEVTAIYAVVEKSVPGLMSENIALVDTNGNKYEQGGADGMGSVAINDRLAMKEAIQGSLEEQLINLYTPVFGRENLSAVVNVELNFDQESVTTVTLSPVTDVGEDGNIGIIKHLKETAEVIKDEEVVEGEPGVDPNGGAPTYPELEQDLDNSKYYKVTQEYDAAVNEINETLVRAQGSITDISCTFIINNSSEEMEELLPEIKTQISTAIGAPVENISVMARPFVVPEPTETPEIPIDPGAQQQDMLMWYIAGGALVLVILILILMMRSSKKRRKAEVAALQKQLDEERRRQQEILEAAEAEASRLAAESILQQQDSDTLTQIRELAQRSPEAVAQLLRNWLYDGYRR